MPRVARFVPADSYFHLLSRGNNKQTVFYDEQDHLFFLKLLKNCSKEFSWKIHHYVLMKNHYHLLIHNPVPAELSKGVKLLNLKYAQYFRRKYGGSGHLWQDRFKSFVVEARRYFLECGRYIELNPVRAGIVSQPQEYRWSSYHFYAFGKKDEIVTPSPEYLGLAETSEKRQQYYRELVCEKMKEKRGLERYFRSGFYGSKEFGKKLKSLGLKERKWKTGPKGPWKN